VASILGQQLDAMVEDLNQALAMLSTVPLSPRLTGRIGHNFQTALGNDRSRYLELRSRLNEGEDEAKVWTCLREQRPRTRALLAEVLALVQGSLARDANVAVDACELADALLDELNDRLPVSWRRFTVVADSEFVSGPADIIRLRFPEVTIWSLPIVAHELGHFVAHALWEGDQGEVRSFPVRRLLESEATEHGPFAARQLEEMFADVFATWAIGPAYPMACLCLRFDPVSETEPFDDHPSDVARTEAMLRTLEYTASRVVGQQEITRRLRALWDESRAAAGPDVPELSSDEKQSLESRLPALFDLIERHLPIALYESWHEAAALADELAEDDGEFSEDRPAAAPWDVINAGWLCRLEAAPGNAYGMRRLAERTANLCQRRIAA
jgi:hypothetical protein